jgi:hypothetical protein
LLLSTSRAEALFGEGEAQGQAGVGDLEQQALAGERFERVAGQDAVEGQVEAGVQGERGRQLGQAGAEAGQRGIAG